MQDINNTLEEIRNVKTYIINAASNLGYLAKYQPLIDQFDADLQLELNKQRKKLSKIYSDLSSEIPVPA